MTDQIIDIGYRVFHDSCVLEASCDFLRILGVLEGSCTVSVPGQAPVFVTVTEAVTLPCFVMLSALSLMGE